MTKKPCIGCIYYKECGSSTRTEPCAGRMTKTDKKKEIQTEKQKNNK